VIHRPKRQVVYRDLFLLGKTALRKILMRIKMGYVIAVVYEPLLHNRLKYIHLWVLNICTVLR